MNRKWQTAKRMITILSTMGTSRLLAALGRSEQAMYLTGRRINAPKMKALAFAGYEPTEQDVFVATFGKSGTYWTLQITQQIAYYGSAEFDYIHDLVPWPDLPMPEVKARLDDPTIAQRAPTGLRIIKTHHEREYVPFRSDAKYVTVIRDPKEVVVSGYYFAKPIFASFGVTYDLEQWVRIAQHPDEFLFGDWAAHTAGWWAVRDEPNVFVVTYSELKRHPATIIRQIAEFMEVQLTTEELERVIEKSSFKWMKAHKSQFKAPMPPGQTSKSRPPMMRAGQTGNSGELLSAEQQTCIDDFYRARLKNQFNSDFPYDEVFVTASDGKNN